MSPDKWTKDYSNELPEPELIEDDAEFNDDHQAVEINKDLTARDVAEAHGWVWKEHPVLGHQTDLTQKIFDAIFRAAKIIGQEDTADTDLRAKIMEQAKELEHYQSEWPLAIEDNGRLTRELAAKDDLIIALQNEIERHIEGIRNLAVRLAREIGFPEEYVFRPRA